MIDAKFWVDAATPGLVAVFGNSNLTTAGSVLLYSVTLKNTKPLSAEFNPSPVVQIPIFSTNICCPAVNREVADSYTQLTLPTNSEV